MRFDDVFNITGEEIERDNIPKEYQKFLPENIVKDKFSHPYSYDPFLIFFNPDFNSDVNKKPVSTIYTDRLSQWDYKKERELAKEHMPGKRWDNASKEEIEAFLSAWTKKDIVLIANIQYVNLSSGYAVWRLDFYER